MLRNQSSHKSKRHSDTSKSVATDRLVAIQIVFTRWDKASRGGLRATLRNQVPEAVELLLPDAPIVEPSFVVHTSKHVIDHVPVDTYVPKRALQVFPVAEIFTCGSISVRLIEDRVHVDYQWSHAAGMPERYPGKNVLILEKDQWGQVRYNERHSAYYTRGCFDMSDWWYEKWVFNIGFFSALEPRIFLDSKPTQIYSRMQLLR